MRLEPVVRTVTLPCPGPAAFAAFTAEIGQWWDARFSSAGDELAGIVMEGRLGGRLFEVSSDGDEYDWGTVTDWVPDRRVTFEWTLGLAPGTTSALDVDFTDIGGGTRMHFEHGGWDDHQAADRAKFAAADGWDVLLAAYREHVEQGL